METKIIAASLSKKRTHLASPGKMACLLHLRKAIREEAYETCPYWIGEALGRGLTARQILAATREPGEPLENLLDRYDEKHGGAS